MLSPAVGRNLTRVDPRLFATAALLVFALSSFWRAGFTTEASYMQLALPQLEKLLARLVPGLMDAGDAESLSMPHERVMMREAGVQAADGCIPLAAMEAAQTRGDAQGHACAWITPRAPARHPRPRTPR